MGIDDSSLAAGGATDPFLVGQEQDAINNLGDPRQSDGTTPAWDEHFLQDLHGLILIAGDSHATIEKKKAEIELIFRVNTPTASVKEIIAIRGDVRPGKEAGHEQ